MNVLIEESFIIAEQQDIKSDLILSVSKMDVDYLIMERHGVMLLRTCSWTAEVLLQHGTSHEGHTEQIRLTYS